MSTSADNEAQGLESLVHKAIDMVSKAKCLIHVDSKVFDGRCRLKHGAVREVVIMFDDVGRFVCHS